MKIAVLDDWSGVAGERADWDRPTAEIAIFQKSPGADLVGRLQSFAGVCLMRERIPFSGDVIGALPNLRRIVITGPRNLGIDAAAARHYRLGHPVAQDHQFRTDPDAGAHAAALARSAGPGPGADGRGARARSGPAAAGAGGSGHYRRPDGRARPGAGHAGGGLVAQSDPGARRTAWRHGGRLHLTPHPGHVTEATWRLFRQDTTEAIAAFQAGAPIRTL